MLEIPYLLVIALACAVLAFFETKFSIKLIKRMGVYDKPNKRSNHKEPTPRGGGIAIIDGIVISFLLISIFLTKEIWDIWPVLLVGFVLAVVSFVDDLKNISISYRLLAQIAAVAVGTYTLTQDGLLFQGMFHPLLDSIIIAVIWLWFVNLYNFMDGIDMISSAQSIAISIGIFIIALMENIPFEFGYYGLAIAAVCAGFLYWNITPAKVFMGDVGSISLGYFLGWLLLKLAILGYWQVSVILPLYYFADSSITITKRLLRGEKIWEAHSKHYYQQAVMSGRSHLNVVKSISVVNALLIFAAVYAAAHPQIKMQALIISCILVFSLLQKLAKTK